MERRLVLWFPDWPVAALLRSRELRAGPEAPIAVLAHNTVVNCSPAARRDGVRRGMRRRDAQSRCPGLLIAPDDPARDAREFLPVADRIEQLAPGLQIIRPGLCSLRIRGPARYYGGEFPAAATLVRLLRDEGLVVRAGVADGRFAAERAARLADEVRIVPEGGSAEFLAPLPVVSLEDDALAALLGQLGIRTLGAFAALGAAEVLDRFGPAGALLHALAAGDDGRRFVPREVPPDHAAEITFEPPLALAEQVAFSMRVTAERFIDGLAAARLSCTELRVELVGPDGDGTERVWAHPSSFDAAAVIDRVRWQLDGSEADALRGGVAAVRLLPEAVGSIAAFEPGLFGRGGDERVGHVLSRVQAMLGHRGVLTARPAGGRRLADRIALTAWGDRQVLRRDTGPWPGSLPAPHPARVYPRPLPIRVEGRRGEPVQVGGRGVLLTEPAWIVAEGDRRRITAWAGPWPSVERGWDPASVRRSHRFQAVDEAGGAWALLLEAGEWSAEGRYD